MITATLSYTRSEQLVDRWIHYAGLVAALIGSVALIGAAAEQRRSLTLVCVAIYAVGLIAMIGSSALYNLAEPSPRKEWLRRLDHAGIFLMIAGTYTPFALIRMGDRWGFGIAAVVWLTAVAGIALKLLYPRRFERLSLALYLALGWIILIALEPLFHAVSLSAFILLAVGGILYSLGVLFHLADRLPYHNAVWHVFVLGAAACHFVAVLNGVVRAA
jgi:hemolysin III